MTVFSRLPRPLLPTLLLGACLAPAAVRADDLLDTWVTFAFEDPHILASAEDGYARGGFYADDRSNTFFDNYDSQFTGRETLSHIVLYKRMPGIITGLDAEGALVSRFTVYHDTETGKPFTKFRDDGSYIRLSYFGANARSKRVGNGLSLTAFPYDSERFKLGYSYDLTWAGKRTFVGNQDPVPGMKVEYNYSASGLQLNTFVGAKNARLLDDSINEQQTYFGVMGGVGADVAARYRLDLQGGFFNRGAFPAKNQLDENGQDLVLGKPMYAFGVSSRAGYHVGTPIGRSADFRLYRKDPTAMIQDLKPERYEAGTSYAVEGELSLLGQNLLDPDELATTVIQPAMAWDINMRMKHRYLRTHVDVVYRSLSFILFNVPGMSPYYDFPDAALHSPETFIALGFDRFIPKWRLTPGLTIGYQKPATYSGNIPDVQDTLETGNEGGSTTIVVRDEGNFEILPENASKFDIITAKGTLRWELGESLNFLSELSYTLDKNQTKYARNLEGDGTSQRIFDDPDVYNKISFSLFLQARF